MKDDSNTSHDAVVERARRYLKEQGVKEDLVLHEVFYRSYPDADMRAALESDLKRVLDEDELRLMQIHNKPGWIVQFVFEECESGATPQGSRVLLCDDGDITHYRPM